MLYHGATKWWNERNLSGAMFAFVYLLSSAAKQWETHIKCQQWWCLMLNTCQYRSEGNFCCFFFFLFAPHHPEQRWLCNPKSIGIWHTSMCDNKTHMTWIRFHHMPFNYGRFVICLHGLYSHFPNGVHISISRNSSKIFFKKKTSTQSRTYEKEIVPNNWTCKQMQKIQQHHNHWKICFIDVEIQKITFCFFKRPKCREKKNNTHL